MVDDDDIVQQVIERYGPVIDMRENPSAIIDIIQRFGPDGGLPPGGAPSPPPPPPGPTSFQDLPPTMEELMREVLKLSRQVSLNTQEVTALRTRLEG